MGNIISFVANMNQYTRVTEYIKACKCETDELIDVPVWFLDSLEKS